LVISLAVVAASEAAGMVSQTLSQDSWRTAKTARDNRIAIRYFFLLSPVVAGTPTPKQ
jgi:hypothetical protein